MRKPKDETIRLIEIEIATTRAEMRIYGRQDYLRGMLHGLRLALGYRRAVLKEETSSK